MQGFGQAHPLPRGLCLAPEHRGSAHPRRLFRRARYAAACLTGAHKDDLIIDINGQPARAFASQGQTRTAALSLKLAEREIFHDEFDEYPVLMLDDVLSELDAQRQAFVLNRIGGGQTLITCCEDDRLPQLLGGRIFHVKNGTVR